MKKRIKKQIQFLGRTTPVILQNENGPCPLLAISKQMLLLFETPAGFAIFKVLDEGKLSNVQDLGKEFDSPDSARKMVKLKAFYKFDNTSEAFEAVAKLLEGAPSKGLRKFLKANCKGKALAVADSNLGNVIKEKLKIDCVNNDAVMELLRGVRSQFTELISWSGDQDLASMRLGLSHRLAGYKLKSSSDMVDTMIIQATGLLDDLNKELNKYAMRVREWYGWHFPELAKIISDNIVYAKSVKLMGNRINAARLDFSEILAERVEVDLKEAAVISMGTDVSDLDLMYIRELCDQVLSLAEYRDQLYDYLKSRMNTVAPNLTALVGELVGARLISHGGGLLKLSKKPGSTIQLLGAEKALFRALEKKHATPKYGLIYHASVVVQAAPKHKGKISRSLAAKIALAIRVDAFGQDKVLFNIITPPPRKNVDVIKKVLENLEKKDEGEKTVEVSEKKKKRKREEKEKEGEKSKKKKKKSKAGEEEELTTTYNGHSKKKVEGVAPRKNVDVMKEVLENLEKKDEGEKTVEVSEKKKKRKTDEKEKEGEKSKKKKKKSKAGEEEEELTTTYNGHSKKKKKSRR